MLLLAALAVLAATAVAAAALRSLTVAAAGCVAAAAAGIAAAGSVLLGGDAGEVRWTTPLGFQGALRLDPLSAWFLLVFLFVAALCAIYGRRALAASTRPMGMQAGGYGLLVLSMCVLVAAGDALTFLMAWELMTLAAFLLVTHEHHRPEVRRAGLLYLVLTHAATACLLALFAWLAASAHSLDFADMARHPPLRPRTASALFALAAIGFGCKAGAWPLHVWLPAAHPVAPSHVSGLLSGIVIKAGIYGLLRTLPLLGPLPAGCGLALLIAGVASALLGVLSALAQHELKRLLAYHSIENIGIILIGAGAGFIALGAGRPVVAALGFAGALLHVANHALFKALLFLAAGAVGKSAGTLQIDRLGGLARTMPQTALWFALGAAAISGLPPLNGFVSELLVYLSLLGGAFALPLWAQAASLLSLSTLACVGGLALACFAKATGAVFLGTPRTEVRAHEAPRGMLAPMALLGVSCLAVGLAGRPLMGALARPVLQLSGASLADTVAAGALPAVGAIGAVLIALSAALFALRALLLRTRAEAGPTWGCGYAHAAPSMQYTAASFAQPLLAVFRAALLPQRHATLAASPFPTRVSAEQHSPDPVERFALTPALQGGAAVFGLLRRAQPARVQWYALLVGVALVTLLLWGTR